jgi:leader peptidase (prepilin peptidase) / N-methyltransferase
MSEESARTASGKTPFWTAFVAAALSFVLLPLIPAIFSSLLAGLALWIASVDLEQRIIPDLANAAMALLGLALIVTQTPVSALAGDIADALMRALAAGGVLYLVRFVFLRVAGKEGLGLGDVKLMAAGATLLSWGSLPYALVLAAVAAIMVVVLRGIRQGQWLDRQTEIPFGAFLAPAIWASFLLEQLYLF